MLIVPRRAKRALDLAAATGRIGREEDGDRPPLLQQIRCQGACQSGQLAVATPEERRHLSSPVVCAVLPKTWV